ncbi:hypothetical protein TNCV_877001 [Trichonephila clavipes]|nr:hypothetical protein TNCV_877001 [Trichonephila clavipes]
MGGWGILNSIKGNFSSVRFDYKLALSLVNSSPTPPLTMVCQKKLFVFFVIMMLGLLVPGPSMTGVEAMHLGGGGGGGMRGVELLLAAGIIAKLLDQHHHHHG